MIPKISYTFILLLYLLIIKEKKGHKTAAYADNLFLPFALLEANTFLPPGVLILALNPWTLDLCLVLGWNVIFMWETPPSHIYNQTEMLLSACCIRLISHSAGIHCDFYDVIGNCQKGRQIPCTRKYHNDYIKYLP